MLLFYDIANGNGEAMLPLLMPHASLDYDAHFCILMYTYLLAML